MMPFDLHEKTSHCSKRVVSCCFQGAEQLCVVPRLKCHICFEQLLGSAAAVF